MTERTMMNAELSAEFVEQREDASLLCEDLEATARISNPMAENGYEQRPGPLTWLNSARVTTDPDDDAVHCVISIDDPRGGLCFTVRRLPNGRIVFHVPQHRGMTHIPSLPTSGPLAPEPNSCHDDKDPRTFVLVDDSGHPRDFGDPEPEPVRKMTPYYDRETDDCEGFACDNCYSSSVDLDTYRPPHEGHTDEPDCDTVCEFCGCDQYEE